MSFMSFDYDLSNADDDGESASEKAKQRVRERAEEKLRKEQLKETKAGNVDRKKTGKKSVGLLGRIGALPLVSYINCFIMLCHKISKVWI